MVGDFVFTGFLKVFSLINIYINYNFFNRMANKMNVILELHRHERRVCENSSLIQVLDPTFPKQSKDSRMLSMKVTDQEET